MSVLIGSTRRIAYLSVLLALVLTACGSGSSVSVQEPVSQQAQPEEAQEADDAPAPQPPTAPPASEPTPVAEPDASGDTTGAEWQEFSSEEGGFSVLMPGTPRENVQRTGAPGSSIHHASFQVKFQASSYVVSYSNLDREMLGIESPSEFLANTMDVALDVMNAQLMTQQDIALDGNPGKAFSATATIEGVETAIEGRYYLVEDRLYQVLAMGHEGSVSEADKQKFLESFKLR
jgi:hypothetical protein